MPGLDFGLYSEDSDSYQREIESNFHFKMIMLAALLKVDIRSESRANH